jgi:hypothetical protein
MAASTTTEIKPRTKIVSPLGIALPRYFTHAAMLDKSTTEVSFKNTPRTGRCRCAWVDDKAELA